MRSLKYPAILTLVLYVSAATWATRAVADEYPVVPGDYWSISGVKLKDGGGLAYANYLAGEWRANQEFAKSKGWIKGYMVFQNIYPRAGEPDLYLVTTQSYLESGVESEKRNVEYMEWKKKTIAQMDKEMGDRAEFRELEGNLLLQELLFRK